LSSPEQWFASGSPPGREEIVRSYQRTILSLVIALLALAAPALTASPIRVTTWNLEWFPNGSPKELPASEQDKRIAAAADVLRPLNPDIILLQEVRDYDVCTRLANAIAPHTYQVAICSAFREPYTSGLGKQQVAILAKQPAQAAWSESWKSMAGIDPPRGFAFAWFKIGGTDVGIYSLHLKSNLIMKSDKAAEGQKNIRKREVAIEQLLNHVRDVIAPSMPMVKSFVVGGDFNTNLDQPDFAAEKTLSTLTAAGFRNSMEGASLLQRVTHPGKGPYPDATFDYLFGSNLIPAKPQITASKASDHYPVTCDFSVTGTYAQQPQTAPAPNRSQVQAGNENGKNAFAPQFVTLTQPVKIKVPYGETVLPRGLKLAVLSRNAQSVTVKYLDETPTIPISATDLQ
jgi:endonuclease/exonuclease/phosphatase family metal-dependent hydrolase